MSVVFFPRLRLFRGKDVCYMILESHFECRIKSIFEYWKTCFMHFERNIIAFQIVVVFWCKYYSTESKTIVYRRSLLSCVQYLQNHNRYKVLLIKQDKDDQRRIFFSIAEFNDFFFWLLVKTLSRWSKSTRIISLASSFQNQSKYYARETYMDFQAIWHWQQWQ